MNVFPRSIRALTSKLLTRSVASMTTDSLHQQKDALRKAVRAKLAELSEEEIAHQSQSIVQQVINMPEYRKASSISVFLSMPGKEVSTREIVLDAFSQGKAVYVPYIYAIGEGKPKQKVMDMLRLRDQNDFDSLKADSWGIPSLGRESVDHRDNALGCLGLLRDAEPVSGGSPHLDLIFMPAVAFDLSRNRLGHGRGFYDRYLQKYHAATAQSERDMPKLVGLALRQQVLSHDERVPADQQDWIVDTIVTSQ